MISLNASFSMQPSATYRSLFFQKDISIAPVWEVREVPWTKAWVVKLARVGPWYPWEVPICPVWFFENSLRRYPQGPWNQQRKKLNFLCCFCLLFKTKYKKRIKWIKINANSRFTPIKRLISVIWFPMQCPSPLPSKYVVTFDQEKTHLVDKNVVFCHWLVYYGKTFRLTLKPSSVEKTAWCYARFKNF